MQCLNCGKPVSSGIERCESCGAAIDQSGVTAPSHLYLSETDEQILKSTAGVNSPISGKAHSGKRTIFSFLGITLIVLAAVETLMSVVANISSVMYQANPGGVEPFSIAVLYPILSILFLIVLVVAGILMFGEARRLKSTGERGSWATVCGIGDIILAFSQLVSIGSFLAVSITFSTLINVYGLRASEVIFMQSIINLIVLFFSVLPGVFYIVSGILEKKSARSGWILIAAGILFIVGPLIWIAVQTGFSSLQIYMQNIEVFLVLMIPVVAVSFAAWVFRGYALIKIK